VIDTPLVIPYDAVLLAGGAARRLGGVDKPMTPVAGRPMLEWVIDAVGDARSIVVVGPRRRLAHHVQWTREDPPGGGPVAALAAGLAVLADASPVTVVLAGDLPFIGAAIRPLLDAATSAGVDGALVADSNGHDQPLAAAYRRDALDRQLAALGSPAGVALRDLIRPMRLVRVASDDALDCDTWDDVRRAEERAIGGIDDAAGVD
jgi:molybdopterin-guanine dinucleotide biosynthesis protein A